MFNICSALFLYIVLSCFIAQEVAVVASYIF